MGELIVVIELAFISDPGKNFYLISTHFIYALKRPPLVPEMRIGIETATIIETGTKARSGNGNDRVVNHQG